MISSWTQIKLHSPRFLDSVTNTINFLTPTNVYNCSTINMGEKEKNVFIFRMMRWGNNFLDIWGSFWSLILFLINFLLWNKINTYSKVQINPLSWIWVFLNFSIKTWSNFKIRDSFEIYMFSAFQNCPWFWNLANYKLRKLR